MMGMPEFLAAGVGALNNLQRAWEAQGATFPSLLGVFLSLVAQGVGLALILGLPLGIALTRWRRLANPSISVLAVVQTLPSLALLGLLIPILGVGRAPTLVATVLYSLLPIVMNTYVGIVQVSPAVRDAARGMGLSSMQALWQVELPLALPVLLAGVRTGVVFAIGVITVCALAGAGGLGEYITRGLSRGDDGLVLLGALPILAITLVAFWSVGAVAALARRNASLGLLVALVLTLGLALYAVVESFPRHSARDGGRRVVVIACKNFTESFVLAEMMRLLVEEEAGLRVERRYGLGSHLAYRALVEGDADIYPEYTGTLLTAVDALDNAVVDDGLGTTEFVRRGMKERFDLHLLDAFGLNNTYAMCVPRAVAQRFQLSTIEDLRRAPELRAVLSDEFLDRQDGWPGLARLYGIELDVPPRVMTPELMYVALRGGQAELCSGFATDWQIGAYDLVVLEDTKGYFPNYHAAPLVRADLLERHPEVGGLLRRLGGQISNEVIRGLNARVAVEKRSETDVAREFLNQQGLLKTKR